MSDMLRESVQGIGPHVVYFILSLFIAALFITFYIRVTPYRELALIRQGNAAAAISLGGALVGFCIPLAKAVAKSASIADMLIWSGVALIAQLIAFLIVRTLLKDIAAHIEEARSAPAIFLAAVSIGIGLLNAAAMTA